MKRFFLYLVLTLLLLAVVAMVQNYPIAAEVKSLPRLADTTRIRKNLILVIDTPWYRTYNHTEVLDTVAGRIQRIFLQATPRVNIQPFMVDGRHFQNVIASFGPEDGQRVIVGAHYDACGAQEGADDNASGVAGLLELAALLKQKAPTYRIDLVAYSLEEPPYFRTWNMGSYVHAKSLHDAGVPVRGMISLEMIGYYSDKEGSQDYPVNLLRSVFGTKGNYLTVVQKSFCGDFAKEFKSAMFKVNSMPVKSFRAPSFFGGIDLSDHRNYWEFGYSAVMVTNTAFFRNKNYHLKTDLMSTLDIGRLGLAVDGVYRALMAL